MARTQSKDYHEVRERIMRSAAALFAEKGFAATTVVDLAQACGSSRGALYHYFESKEEILSAILGEHVTTMLQELQSIGEARLDPIEHLRALARKIMELNAVNNSEQIVLLNDWNQLDPALRADLALAQRKIVGIVRDALARLDVDHRMTPKFATTYAMSLLGSLNYTYAWYDSTGPVSPAEYADLVIDLFLDGFRSSGAAR